MFYRTVLLFFLASLLEFSFARLTSFGNVTVMAARAGLEDSDFVIDTRMGAITRTPDFVARTAELSRFPVLAGGDVQSQITRVSVFAGRAVVTHYHPRGVEVLNVLRGTFMITLRFEGANPRMVTNMVKAGQSTVFPHGLVHRTACTSATKCLYISVFNTADPGFVPLPMMTS